MFLSLVDDIKPTLEPGVACFRSPVLAGAGQRVPELVQDITRFSVEEDLFPQLVRQRWAFKPCRNKKAQLCRGDFVETGIGLDR